MNDDAELLARTPTDADAFAAFYRRHERAVLTYFVRRTRDAELAADLAAETFAAALMAARRFDPEQGPPLAWLFGIARNKLLRSIERGRVEESARRRLGLAPLELDEDLLSRIEALGADERTEVLLDALPEEQQRAVRGRVVDELSYGELAQRLSCSEAVVRQRVSRGLAALRRKAREAT